MSEQHQTTLEIYVDEVYSDACRNIERSYKRNIRQKITLATGSAIAFSASGVLAGERVFYHGADAPSFILTGTALASLALAATAFASAMRSEFMLDDLSDMSSGRYMDEQLDNRGDL